MRGAQRRHKGKAPAKAVLSGKRSPRRSRKQVTLQEVIGLSDVDIREAALNLKAVEAPMAALKAQVDRLLGQLTPREREVLNLRFGIKP